MTLGLSATANRWRTHWTRGCEVLHAVGKIACASKRDRNAILVLLADLMKLPANERSKVLSEDQSQFPVGLTNQTTRDAWVQQALSRLPAGARLLDAGAGECVYKKYCGHVHYVSQDLAKYDGSGDVGLQTGTFDTSRVDILSDITAIPEPDASFDAILCTEVLEHVSDPIRALEELGRLLKSNGTLILTAPFCSMTHFAPHHHATGFSRFFYELHLPRIGLEIEELAENGNFFEFGGQQLRQVRAFGDRYADYEPDRLERFGTQIVLRMLTRMSKQDKRSAELLNYGYHVRAVKRRTP
jgi:SAM-dependent methyltransferase